MILVTALRSVATVTVTFAPVVSSVHFGLLQLVVVPEVRQIEMSAAETPATELVMIDFAVVVGLAPESTMNPRAEMAVALFSSALNDHRRPNSTIPKIMAKRMGLTRASSTAAAPDSRAGIVDFTVLASLKATEATYSRRHGGRKVPLQPLLSQWFQ